MEAPSADHIFELVSQKLRDLDLAPQEDREFTLRVNQVDSSVVWEVIERIGERLPVRPTYDSTKKIFRFVLNVSATHQAPLSWVFQILGLAYGDEIFTPDEWAQLRVSSNTPHTAHTMPFTGSVVQPDIFIRKSRFQNPHIVLEVGWTETMDDLYSNRNILLHGSKNSVTLVVLIKWTLNRTANTVEGILEVWELDSDGITRCRQREVIFPAPAPGSTPQTMKITKAEILKNSENSDITVQDPRIVEFPLDILREIAAEGMKRDGYLPACASRLY